MSSKDHEFGFETLCLHAGQLPDPTTAARAVPIYQTTSYLFDNADHAASLFNLQTFGNIYTRLSNPTTAVFEERMAALENGRAGLAVSSGMAASTIALATLVEQGDHIVAARTLYGGTHTLLDFNFKRFGIEATLVDRTIRRPSPPPSAPIPRSSCRDHRQSDQRARHRGGGGGRAARPATDARQHVSDALSSAAPRLGRGHRHPFRDQVPRRAARPSAGSSSRPAASRGTTASSPA